MTLLESNLGGKQGAKRQTWAPVNPRELLARIVKENPHMSESEIHALWHVAIYEDPMKYLEGLMAYWFAPNYRALKGGAPANATANGSSPSAKPKQQHQQPQPVVHAEVTRAASHLLDWYRLSTGKMLRESTFGECAKESGWLRKLSKLGDPAEIVGRVLTDDQVAAVFK